jgi:hypothetical protein
MIGRRTSLTDPPHLPPEIQVFTRRTSVDHRALTCPCMDCENQGWSLQGNRPEVLLVYLLSRVARRTTVIGLIATGITLCLTGSCSDDLGEPRT